MCRSCTVVVSKVSFPKFVDGHEWTEWKQRNGVFSYWIHCKNFKLTGTVCCEIPVYKHGACDSDVPCCGSSKCNAGCTLSPSAFGESLWRELPEMKLGECDSTLLPRALNPREVSARRGCTDKSENKVYVGEDCSHVCWLKWVGLK